MLLCIIMSSCVVTFQQVPQTTPDNPETSIPSSPISPGWQSPNVNSTYIAVPSFADVVEKVYPSVVSINTESVVFDFFSQPLTQKGAGSGWVLDKEGSNSYIVTNNHVVEGAKKVIVETYDNKTFEVSPDDIRRDSVSDLAMLNINSTSLQPAAIGDSSKLRVGDFVIAVGNPLGQGLRAKEGTVSGLKVKLPVEQGQYLYDLIETSAAINPGNSGGPLVNLSGEVVGITSAKMAAVGIEGMGYAISIKTAIPIIEQLIKQGYVIRPYVGVATIENNDYVANVNRLSSSQGVVVWYLDPAGPASKAGIQKLDIITYFKGVEISTPDQLVQLIHDSNIGDDVSVTIIREQQTLNITIKLSESPRPK